MRRILYISYTGILEPLGQSQVFSYLERLSSNYQIILLSFERDNDWHDLARRHALQQKMRGAGIIWHPLRYHKKPGGISTCYDIFIGLFAALWLARKHRVSIVHARSYIPSVVALGLKKIVGVRYIFDMRGFWADERIDGGIWPCGSRLYRLAKWFERRFLLNADHVVSLTHAGVKEMKAFSYLQDRMQSFTVIPTCTNLELFTPRPEPMPATQPFTLGYVGSLGTWYLLDEMIECFKILRRHRPDARMLFVNRSEHELIRQRLSALGVPEDCVEIRAANHAEVVGLMHRMDAGIFFYKPDFSKKATSPTKLGEFLACGIPCLGNANVGDVETVLGDYGVGVVLREFTTEAMESAVLSLLNLSATPGISAQCRAVAKKEFSLQRGVESYDRIYRSLL